LVLQAAWALGGGQVRYSVPEEAKGGTVVGRLAQDLGLEAGEAEARRLRLVAQGRRASVEVSGASGALVVSSRLDREELCGKSAPCALRLEVLLERPLRVFHVEVEVTDINDNAPLFPAATKNLSIAELITMPGSRFPLEGASDADIGANAQLSYTLSPSEHFTLDLQKTEDSDENMKSLFLVLTKGLDRESLAEHRLVLTAIDGGRPALTGTVELLVSVLDANDNAPQFNQSNYKVRLPESAPPGTVLNATEGTLVTQVGATDLDEGINHEFSFSIVSLVPATKRDVFSIDAQTGEIRLRGPLDFEEVRLYELQIAARDMGVPPLSGHCSVMLEVLDVNDNAPEVWVTSLSVPVPEDASVGTVVALLSVSDRDSGANGRVRCAVWPPAPFGLVATFAGSYSLVLREALDRERVSEYEVEVRAEDGGAPPLRASRGLRVPVSDVNDNAPAFAQAVYTVLARENNAAGAELARLIAESSLPGSRFPLEGASDADIGANAQLSYTLSPSEHFALDLQRSEEHLESLFLVLTKGLDRESLAEHRLVLTAIDGGRPALTGTVELLVSVLDANDNAPQFNQSVYKVRLPEDSVEGTLVAHVGATDPDEGINHEFSFSVVSLVPATKRDVFSIDPMSGEIRLRGPLDFEEVRFYELQIAARDNGVPPLSGHCKVVVEVLDVNDNAPEVWVTSLSVPVPEDASVGTVVALLSVS
ncbi:Protocadherin alpha-2, partial [Anas platyrhynchos]